MRVFGVVKIENEIKLIVWSSKKAFEKTENWCDGKFIRVVTTDELQRYDEPVTDIKQNWGIVRTPDQIKAHNLLNREFLRLNNGKI